MRAWLRRLLPVALALVALAVLFYRARGSINLQDFSWDRLNQVVRQARVSLLLLSLAAIFVSYAIRTLRWQRFCRYLGRPSFWGLYSSTLIGFTCIFLLGRAGEPVRPLVIAKKVHLAVSSMFGIYVLERIFDVGSTAVMLGLALLAFPEMLTSGGVHANWVVKARATGLTLSAALLAAIAFLVYLRWMGADTLKRRLENWRAAPGGRRRAAEMLLGFAEGLQAIQTWGDLFAATVYSAAHWALVALIYNWVEASFGGRLEQIGMTGSLLVLTLTMVGSTLQAPGVGGGSQVASFLAFTVVFGVEKEPAAAAAIVLWVVSFAASSLVGVPLMIREGWSMGELRRMARTKVKALEVQAPASATEKPAERGERPR